MRNHYLIQTVGRVWNEQPHWAVLHWGGGVNAGIKWLELIAEDWTFTFRTDEQRWPQCTVELDGTCNTHKPYGP